MVEMNIFVSYRSENDSVRGFSCAWAVPGALSSATRAVAPTAINPNSPYLFLIKMLHR
jgi:hypothetical protein